MPYGQLNVDSVVNSDGVTSGGLYGFKNRIINGAMVIDQRNAGASVTVNNNGNTYSVDRWVAQGQGTDGVFTVQQSSTAPTGFTNSIAIAVTTADASIGSTQYYFLSQRIEGYNVADLGFGAAGAATVTFSFWIRSSLTGAFGGSLSNDDVSRSYPFTYTINAANTWEQKTVTIAGDTSGTWLKTNGIGLRVYFNIGAGSGYTAAANAWASQWAFNATGGQNLIATSGATMHITGVQLEKGSTATSFDYRPYGTELALCQRYTYVIKAQGGYSCMSSSLFIPGSTVGRAFITMPVTMRSAPTATYTAANTFLVQQSSGLNLVPSSVSTTGNGAGPNFFSIDCSVTGAVVASAGILYDNNTSSAQITLSAEL